MEPITYEAVYYVHSNDNNFQVNPIGIRPQIDEDLAWWDDTNPLRGTSFRVARVDVDKKTPLPKEIIITTDDGRVINLTYMTLDIYNEYVRNQAVGKPIFHNDQEVQAYYLNTDFSS